MNSTEAIMEHGQSKSPWLQSPDEPEEREGYECFAEKGKEERDRNFGIICFPRVALLFSFSSQNFYFKIWDYLLARLKSLFLIHGRRFR